MAALRDILTEVPGIGTGAAYADKDAFGTGWEIVNALDSEFEGEIVGVYMLDKDDEGVQIDVAFFSEAITTPTDNAAFAPTDAELEKCLAVVSIDRFSDWSVNRFGEATSPTRNIVSTGTSLFCYAISRGAPNIAASNVPKIGVVIRQY